MAAEEALRIGYFGDMRREQAGANLFERVVATGSLVLRAASGRRGKELSAGRFLASPHVKPEEMMETAGRRTAETSGSSAQARVGGR